MSTPEDNSPISAEDAFGGWPGMDLGGETETPPAEAPTPTEGETAAPGTTESEEAPPTEGEATTEPEVPAWKQYGFKDEEAMWKSYKELQGEFTRLKQGVPAVEEPEDEPAPTWKDHNFQALGEIPQVGLSAPQRTQLADLMQVDPRAAALWAYQNQQFMEAADFKAVQNNFAAADPEEYWSLKEAIAEHRQAAVRQESEASQREWVLTQQREHAIVQAKQALPLMDEKSDEFGEWLNQPENADISNMLDSIQDPSRLQNALVSAFYQFAGPTLYQELVNSHAAVAEQQRVSDEAAKAEEAAREAASKRGRTQTKTSAAASSTESDADEALRQAILAPWSS